MCLIKLVHIILLFYILTFNWFFTLYIIFGKNFMLSYKIYIKQYERGYIYYFIENIIIELIS